MKSSVLFGCQTVLPPPRRYWTSCMCPNLKLHLSEFEIVFVKFLCIFVQTAKYICPNSEMKSSALFGCQTVLPPPWQEDIGPADIRPAAAGGWGCKKYPRKNIKHHIIKIYNDCDIEGNFSVCSNANILITRLDASHSSLNPWWTKTGKEGQTWKQLTQQTTIFR